MSLLKLTGGELPLNEKVRIVVVTDLGSSSSVELDSLK